MFFIFFLCSDFTLNVIDIDDTNHVTKFKGHTAPILSVAMDPQLEYVVRPLELRVINMSNQATEK